MTDLALDTHTRSVGIWLRLLDTSLTVLHWFLVFVTCVAVPLAALALTGRGSFSLDAVVEPPYTVGLDQGRSVEVPAGGAVAYKNFEPGEERRFLRDAPTVHTRITIDRDDLDTRAVGVLVAASWLSLAWVALTSLRRIVGTARSGNPFVAGNVRRLRWLAASALAFPVVTYVATRLLDLTLDTDPAVHLRSPGPGWWLYGVLGLALLTLAEIFGHGVELRRLEEATI